MFKLSEIIENELREYMPWGIHEGVRIKSIEMSNDYVAVTYADDEGRVAVQRLAWDPDVPWKNENETEEETKAKIVKQNVSQLSAIMKLFVSDEVRRTFSAPDAKTYFMKAVNILTPLIEQKKVDIKLLPTKKGYTTFGNYGGFIALHKEDEPCTLKFSTYEQGQIDKFTGNVEDDDVSEEGDFSLFGKQATTEENASE